MQDTVEELKKSKTQEECLRKAYDILIAKYQGNHIKTITRLFNIFEKDVNVLWNRSGFLHCTSISLVFKKLLLESGFFKEDEIRTRWTLIWYVSPHQYLQVKIGDEWINVDAWANVYGIEFGDYAHGFH